jgi:asparagine synthase (glutamine-hydrolysing)
VLVGDPGEEIAARVLEESPVGQFLILHGADTDRRRDLRDAALGSFRDLCDLEPSDRQIVGSTELIKFSRRIGPSPGIARNSEADRAVCTSGSNYGSSLNRPDGVDSLGSSIVRADRSLHEVLAAIDGAFVIAVADGTTDTLSLVTDKIGSLHAYWVAIDSTLVVSTSSLVLADLSRPGWNPVAVHEFLATGTVFEQRSLFEGITKLGPAAIVRARSGSIDSTERYWSVPDAIARRSGSAAGVNELADALEQSLDKILRVHPRPVVDLTGGLDSRCVLGALLRRRGGFETVVNGPADHPDVLAARRIASSFRLRHRHQRLPADWPRRWWHRAKSALPLCDGEYDIFEYARVLEFHDRLAPEFDVSVNGSGGELCKGYWWELLIPHTGRRGRFDARKVAAARFAIDPWASRILDDGLDLVSHFAGMIRRASAGMETHRNTACMDNVYLMLRMQRWQGRIASSTNRIWSCVSPFMFREPMEIALAASVRDRSRNRMARRLVERFDPALAALPLAQGYPALPLRPSTMHRFLPLGREIARKAARKLGRSLRRRSVPATAAPDAAMREVLSGEPELREIVRADGLLTEEFFRPEMLRGFLASAAAGTADQAKLGRVVTLEYLARSLTRGARPE